MSLASLSLRAASLVALFALWTAPAAAAEPVTVAIALDTSGSIAKPEFDKARTLCVSVLEALPPGSDAGLFTFDDQERLLLPWGSSADDVRRGLAIVGRTGRFTALHDALYEASRKLQAAPPGRKALLLITDGKDEGSTLTLEDGLRVAQDSRIPIWVVGMGRVQEKTLKRIAKLTAGEYIALRGATASGLAEKIVSAPPAPGANAATAPAGASAASAATARGASSLAPASAPPVAAAAAPRRWPWAVLGVGLVLAAGIGMAVMRRRAQHRCPTCGFELAGALSTCTYCSAEANDRVAKAAHAKVEKPRLVGLETMRRDRSPVAAVPAVSHSNGNGNGRPEQLSETVLARMSSTEEYLEKTVTLRELPVLVITAGPGAGRVFTLSPEMTTCVGRAKLNDIILEDISVSSEHFRVRPQDGGFFVHDLKSTNGTYVNAKKVATHPLVAGDVIQIGETSMLFRMDHQRAS